MEYKFATIGEIDRMAELHPVLSEARPDLTTPAFPDNPVVGNDDFPFIFYVEDGDAIVGSRKAIPDRAIIGSEEYDWSWCFDTYVSTTHHGQGIGSKLVAMQVEEFIHRNVISGAAFSAPAMMRIYEKCGYRVLDLTPRMALVRNTAPFLKPKLPVKGLASLAGPAGNLIFAAERFVKGAKRAECDFSIVDIDRNEFEEIFDAAQPAPEQHRWAKNSAWPASRFRSSDRLVKIVDVADATPLALFVVRKRNAPAGDNVAAKRLSLMYFLPLAADRVAAQVIAAGFARLLSECKSDVADIITSWRPLLDATKRRGYRRRGGGMTFVYRVPNGMEIPPARETSEWHLTHFCSDGFFFD